MIVTLLQQLLNGLTLGAVYALVAIGYTLVFGVARLIFFAQGDLSMVAAIVVSIMLRVTAPALGTGVGAAALAITVATGATVAVALLSERFALRPLRRAPKTKQLVSSLGVMLVLQNVVYVTIGSEAMPFPALLPETTWRWGELTVTPVRLVVLATAGGVMAGVWFLVSRTSLGLLIRAVADSEQNAARTGVDRDRTVQWTFALAASVATAAGVMLALFDTVVRYDMGFLPGIKGFTAAVLGGLGSVPGAVVGGLLLGVVEALAAGYVSSDYRHVVAYAVLILVLVFRSRGLLGKSRTAS